MTGQILWAEMTSPELGEAARRGAIVLLPIGAIEQHGAHLPVDTDINGSYEIAVRVANRMEDVLVAPPIWWGLCDSMMPFPGTMTLRLETFIALVRDVCDSIVHHGFRKIAMIVSHAPNKPVIATLVRDVMARHRLPILQLNFTDFAAEEFGKIRRTGLGGDYHAGEFETAHQLYFRPHLVHLDRAVSNPVDPKKHFGLAGAPRDLFVGGPVTIGADFQKAAPGGVLGDPTVATVETGRRVVEAAVGKIAQVLEEYRTL